MACPTMPIALCQGGIVIVPAGTLSVVAAARGVRAPVVDGSE